MRVHTLLVSRDYEENPAVDSEAILYSE